MAKTKTAVKKRPAKTAAKTKARSPRPSAAPKAAAKKAAPVPVKKKPVKGYSARELEYFRKIIVEKRKEILEELSILKESMMDVTTGEYASENSTYSMHMEQGTDAMEREKTFLFASREGKFLNYLDDALRRIEKGTYGMCLDCIDEPKNYCKTCPLIPKERLEAVPHAQLCVECKNRKQKF
ncbi:MAG: conjugal transfer protein TraR [Bacteroidetes bacterium]|nr:MAG: conjugal transfer protein TraR [Bacteroidota bacterium]